jgi:hypothetical protein
VGELGWYEFSGLALAQYITKAEPAPGSDYYDDYLPTYYGDVIHWEEATVINLLQGTDDADIHLVAVTAAPSGPGSISGSIENGEKTEDVPVILQTTGGTVVMTTTAADGTFSFANIAYGTYQIYAEIAGKSVYPHTFTLDEANPEATGIKMVILENSIVFLGISDSEIFESEPMVFPNPVTEIVYLNINLKKPALVEIAIVDTYGRVVSEEQHQISGQRNIAMDVNKLSKGLFYVRCVASGDVIMKKFVKE